MARPPVEANPREIYHSLWPLPALSPVPKAEDKSAQLQSDNESAYRQLLVQGVLAILLPTEDLENECLTALVGQLFSELVIGNLIVNKLSEPWLILEGLIMLTRVARTKNSIKASELGNVGPSLNQKAGFSKAPLTTSTHSLYIQGAFWSLIQWGFILVNSIRLLFSTIMLSRSLPPRSIPTFIHRGNPVSHDDHDDRDEAYSSTTTEIHPQPVKVPIAEFKLWSCVANLLEMDARMPWMSGALSMAQWGAIRGPGRLAGSDGMIDR